jgi:multimeric flavodoxin WrbA
MLILSASNVRRTGQNSRSLVLARQLRDRLAASPARVEIASLRDFPLASCDMCEGCAADGACVQPDGFNRLNALIARHGLFVLVCPHYAGVPSQLAALFEKLQEQCYLAYCQGKAPATARTLAIIAHGGMAEGYEGLYAANLLTPLGNMARSLGWTVFNDQLGRPLVIGVKSYADHPDPGSVCFAKTDDDETAAAVVDRLAAALLGLPALGTL